MVRAILRIHRQLGFCKWTVDKGRLAAASPLLGKDFKWFLGRKRKEKLKIVSSLYEAQTAKEPGEQSSPKCCRFCKQEKRIE